MVYCRSRIEDLARPVEETDGTAEFAMATLRRMLDGSAVLDGFSYELKRSGSTTNNTNVTESSDIDIQVRLHTKSDPSGITPNASPDERFRVWQDFSTRVESALTSRRDTGIAVRRASKSLNLLLPDIETPIDVVPCLNRTVLAPNLRTNETVPTPAIEFWTNDDRPERIVSFPDIQLINSDQRADQTDDIYLGAVRSLKNMRNTLGINPDAARSYHIQSLIYSMPVNRITDGVFTAVRNVVDFMRDPANLENATMVHDRYPLFGTGSVQWHPRHAAEFVSAIAREF